MGMPSVMRMVISSWPRSSRPSRKTDSEKDGSAHVHYFSHSNSKCTTRYCEEKSLGRGAKGAAFSMARRADRSRESMPLGRFHRRSLILAVAADDEIDPGDVFALQPRERPGNCTRKKRSGCAAGRCNRRRGNSRRPAPGPPPPPPLPRLPPPPPLEMPVFRPCLARGSLGNRFRSWRAVGSLRTTEIILSSFDIFPAFAVRVAQWRLELLFHGQVLDAAAFSSIRAASGRRAAGCAAPTRPLPPSPPVRRRRHRRAAAAAG